MNMVIQKQTLGGFGRIASGQNNGGKYSFYKGVT